MNIEEIKTNYKSKTHLKLENKELFNFCVKNDILDKCFPGDFIKINQSQTSLLEIVKILYPNHTILYNDRKTIHPKELDIYVTDLKLAFEYDGVNFHKSEEAKERDTQKNLICEQNGIRLIRITEDRSKRHIESKIQSMLEQLTENGFDCSSINVEFIKKKLIDSIINFDDIFDTAKICKSFKEFTSKYPKFRAIAANFGLIDKIKKIIIENHPKYTEKEIIDILKSCETKKEFKYDFPIVYSQMKDLNSPECAKIYNCLQKTILSSDASDNMKAGWAKRKSLKIPNRPKTEEEKRKYAEHRANTPGPTAGKPLSEEHKNKLRKQWSPERNRSMSKQPLVVCPHCLREGGQNAFKRFHFDNCKLKVV